MEKAWVIVAGDYSSFHVIAVARSEEEAEEICTKRNQLANSTWNEWMWEELPVATPNDVRMVPSYVYRWTWKEGVRGYHPPLQAEPEVTYEAGVGEPTWDLDYDWGFRLRGHTPEQAAKIAQDREAERKAREAGLT